jgi:transposase
MNLSKKKARRKYDSSFKEDVLKMISAGRPIADVSKALGVSSSLIHRWYKATHANSNTSGKNAAQSSTFQQDAFEQIERLKAELRRTEQERDILKKALGIFSRGI